MTDSCLAVLMDPYYHLEANFDDHSETLNETKKQLGRSWGASKCMALSSMMTYGLCLEILEGEH
eukprot:scaffold32067_cov41-Attheya_sp.AAC.1